MRSTNEVLVTCNESGFVVMHYENHDREVIRHFSSVPPDDLGLEVDRCLVLGVGVRQNASSLVTMEEVKSAFDELNVVQRQQLESARRELQDGLKAELDPLLGREGTLRANLADAKNFIERELRKYLDEESAKSVANTVSAKVDDSLRGAERRIEATVRQAMDVTDEKSGVGKVLKAIEAQKAEQGEQFAKLIGEVATAAGKREERINSTR